VSLPASGAAARGCVTRLGLRADSGPVRLPPLLAGGEGDQGGEGFIGLGIGEKMSPIQGSILRVARVLLPTSATGRCTLGIFSSVLSSGAQGNLLWLSALDMALLRSLGKTWYGL